jgi:hypothetical protein
MFEIILKLGFFHGGCSPKLLLLFSIFSFFCNFNLLRLAESESFHIFFFLLLLFLKELLNNRNKETFFHMG